MWAAARFPSAGASSEWAVGAAFGLGYLVLARLGLELATINHASSPFWPAAGVALAAFLTLGARVWPWVFVGAVGANLWAGSSPPSALTIGLGTVLANLAGAWLVRRILRHHDRFGPLVWTWALLVAAFFAPPIAALIGMTGLVLAEEVPRSAFGAGALTWWVGDGIGYLLATPVIISALEARRRGLGRVGWLRAALTVAAAAAGSLALLRGFEGLPFLCLAIPMVFVLTYRSRGVTPHLVALAVAVIAVVTTRLGQGPFQWGTVNANLVNLQIFIGMLSLNVLVVEALKTMGSLRYPAVGLLAGWLVGAVVTVLFVQQESERDRQRAQAIAGENEERIQYRLQTYLDVLRGAHASLLSLREGALAIEPPAWSKLVSALSLPEHYPGLSGIGLAANVAPAELPRFLERMRATYPGYRVFQPPALGPRPPSDRHFLVLRIEPAHLLPQALGLDLAAEARRREAAETASRTGRSAMSGRLDLSKAAASGYGFLIFHPVVREERTLGWVYAPLLIRAFLASVRFDRPDEMGFSLAFADEPEVEVYRSHFVEDVAPSEDFAFRSRLTLAQRPFTLTWRRLRGFESSHDTTAAWVATAFGAISLILAALLAQLSARMRALGEMAGGIAHEINNPLTAIASTVHQLETELLSGTLDRERALARLERLARTSRRITRIIQGLRWFARTGDKVQREEVGLVETVEAAREICADRFRAGGVALRIAPVPEVRLFVVPVQVEQVLVNLLVNALEAVQRARGDGWVEVGFTVSSGGVEIAVSDSGHGVPARIAARIMEPFFTTKDVGEGSGLGLSISRGIAEDHGGSLLLDRSSARTRFVFRLPRLKPEGATSTAAAPAPARG